MAVRPRESMPRLRIRSTDSTADQRTFAWRAMARPLLSVRGPAHPADRRRGLSRLRPRQPAAGPGRHVRRPHHGPVDLDLPVLRSGRDHLRRAAAREPGGTATGPAAPEGHRRRLRHRGSGARSVRPDRTGHQPDHRPGPGAGQGQPGRPLDGRSHRALHDPEDLPAGRAQARHRPGVQVLHLRNAARRHPFRWRHRPVGRGDVRARGFQDLRARDDAGIPGSG